MACVAPAALARATHTSLHVTDKAHLHLIGGGGSGLKETGKANGTLPGKATVTLEIHRYTARSRFTITTPRGSISGKGTGKLKTGKGAFASFGGAVRVTGGTGAYRGARGAGKLYGTINRRDDAMVVNVRGVLRL